MKVREYFDKKTVFSFEVFPPKKTSPVEVIYQTLDELHDLHPDFISVTFGAGGSSNNSHAINCNQDKGNGRYSDDPSALYQLHKAGDQRCS